MNKTKKILLVEDDPGLGIGLTTTLKLESYEVDWQKNLSSGQLAFRPGKFDFVILDIGLPDGSGTDLCKIIREQDSRIPIIFLTAKTDEETVVRGLELGANDFVKKPFSQKELLARIKGLFRSQAAPVSENKIAGLTVSTEKREISFNGKVLDLNRRQFDILVYFLSHPDQIITREMLLNHLDQDGAIYDRTVDSHLSQLRKVMKNSELNTVQIVSVYGVGYRLEVSE